MCNTSPRLRQPSTAFIFLCIIFTFIWFAQLNIRHLIPSDEGRYAEIAREMLVSGDWLAPHYNGYLYFEKPPLQMWFNAATFAVFGIGDWQARLYTAVASFLGILFVAFTGTRVFNARAGFFAALVLAASPYWILLGHFNVLDMGLAFWMELTLCSLLLAQRPNLPTRAVRYWMWLSWAAMAGAVLSKGLIGIMLPGAVLMLYTLITHDFALWRRLYLFSGILIFSALTAPWFVLIQIHHPSFFDFFFVVQHFRRYLTPEQNRPGPFYYFVPVILIGFLPWLSFAVQSIKHALKLPRQANGFSPSWLLFIWSAFIFVFYSLSHSKLISYTLPIAPAIALLLGLYLPLLTRAQWQRQLLFYLTGLAIAFVAPPFLLMLGNPETPQALYRAYMIWVYIALFIMLTGTALSWLMLKRATTQERFTQTVILYACGWFVATTVAGNAHQIFGYESSGVKLVPAVKAEMARLPADTPFYSVNMLDHTVPFYLQRPLTLVQHPDELRFGVTQEPDKWIPTVEAWKQRWQQQPNGFALLRPYLYDKLVEQGIPMRVIARDSRRVVVTKP